MLVILKTELQDYAHVQVTVDTPTDFVNNAQITNRP